jgi:hypothetical protein
LRDLSPLAIEEVEKGRGTGGAASLWVGVEVEGEKDVEAVGEPEKEVGATDARERRQRKGSHSNLLDPC